MFKAATIINGSQIGKGDIIKINGPSYGNRAVTNLGRYDKSRRPFRSLHVTPSSQDCNFGFTTCGSSQKIPPTTPWTQALQHPRGLCTYTTSDRSRDPHLSSPGARNIQATQLHHQHIPTTLNKAQVIPMSPVQLQMITTSQPIILITKHDTCSDISLITNHDTYINTNCRAPRVSTNEFCKELTHMTPLSTYAAFTTDATPSVLWFNSSKRKI